MSRRRLVLVGLVWHRPGDPRTPLGQASIVAALRARGSVDVVSLSFPVEGGSAEWIASEILRRVNARTDVGFGAYIWNERLLRRVLSTLRARGYTGRVLLGGPQVSYSGTGLERLYPEVDVFVRGYAESALCDLYDGVRPSAITGVHLAWQPDREAVAQAPLAALPSPYLEGAMPLVFEPTATRNFVRWETQRGCPYKCSFCQHREAGSRLERTHFELPRVRREIAAFMAAEVDAIAVLDPVFNSVGSHAVDVLGLLRDAGYRGHLSLQCRFEGLKPAFLDALEGLDTTLELGLQTTHLAEGRAVQRFNKPAVADAGLRALRERRIDHEVSLIYGMPNQTLASFRESVDWCLRRGVPRIKAFPLMLLRGTPLERDRDRWRLVENDDDIPQVVSSDSFDRLDHREMARLASALRRTEGRHPATVGALS